MKKINLFVFTAVCFLKIRKFNAETAVRKYIILSAACILSALAVQKAYAVDFYAANSDGKIIYYNIIPSELKVEVTRNGYNSYSGDIVIPESVSHNGNTYSVTVINDAFNDCGTLTSVTIPNSVKTITGKVFRNCNALTFVIIGASVETIDYEVFGDCNSLALTAIYVKAQSPPSAAGAFNNMSIYGNLTVHVPCGSTYNTTPAWSSVFGNKIKEDIIPYDITVQSSDPMAGTVSVTTSCTNGYTAEITATANPNYRFVKWDDEETLNPRTVTLTQDMSFTAIFEVESQKPGGVSNSSYTWYIWLTPDSYNSGTWVNNFSGGSSTGNFIRTKTATAPAKLNTGGYNFHPTVEFKGPVNRMESANTHVTASGDNMMFFVVMKHLGNGGSYDYLLSFNAGATQNRQFRFSGSNKLILHWPTTATREFTFKEGIFTLDNSNNNTSDGMTSYVDGKKDTPLNSGTGGVINSKLMIASRQDNTTYGNFTGTIQEIIILKASGQANNHMEPDDLKKIHSYLAIKYGITLGTSVESGNYFKSDGTKVWDRTAGAGYNSHIFGIARDDVSALYQKQSQSLTNTALTAYVGNGIAALNSGNTGELNNGVYVMFGSNSEAAGTTVTLADGPSIPGSPDRKVGYRRGPVYRAQLTGAAKQKVKLKFEITAEQAGQALPEYVLVSTGSTFASAGTQVFPLTVSGLSLTAEVELSAGAGFITLGGYKSSVLPGDVKTETYTWMAWLTPDSYSSNGTWTNLIQGPGTVGDFTRQKLTPPKISSGYNFHPSVEFPFGEHNDSASYWMRSANNTPGIVPADNLSVIFVMKRSTSNNYYDYILGLSNETSNYKYGIGWREPTASANPYPERLTWRWGGSDATDLEMPDIREGILVLDNANSNDVGKRFNYYLNGSSKSLSITPQSLTAQKIAIASGLNGKGEIGYEGTIQEIILLKANGTSNHINAGDLKKIHSYLAVKYGITLNNSIDYVASNGTTKVWDRTVNSGYSSHIFGIARDDAYTLYQKQAKSASLPIFSAFVGPDLYALNSSNIIGQLENGVYAMFGSNGMDFSLNVPFTSGNLNYRKELVYKTQLTGATSLKVKLRFALDWGAMPEYALISKNAAFPPAETQVIPITGSGASSTIELELSSSEPWYISMGGHKTVNNEGPGGVSTGLNLWLRADDPASIATKMMPAGAGKLEAYPDAGAGTQVPAVTHWKDLVRNITYDTVKAEGTGYGATPNDAYKNPFRLYPVYQPSNYMTNYHPAVRFWSAGNDSNNDPTKAAFLGSEDKIFNDHRPEAHSTFIVVNNNFSTHTWAYPLFFTHTGIGGWGGPGYGVQKADNGDIVGRFRTWTPAGEEVAQDAEYQVAGSVDLFKPGATSILSYHHSWNGVTPAVGGTSYVNFRFNGLVDNNNDNSNGGYPNIWNYHVQHGDGTKDNPHYYDSAWTDLRRRSLLGTGYMFDRTIQGVMSEVIMYNGPLSESDRQKIESYLALKYGVTLTPGTATGKFDYIFSNGDMLWPGATGDIKWANYYNRVAAVIRDDGSNLHNRQSHSTNVGSILHMGIAGTRLGEQAELGDFSTDRQAVIWGDNGASGLTKVVLNGECGDFDSIFNRKWLVHRRTGGKTVNMLVGAQNNQGNQLGTDVDAGTLNMFTKLSSNYSVYMIVADDPVKLSPANVEAGNFKALVPMTYIDGEQQCNYPFTDSITYITFGCKKIGECAATAIFEGTKIFDWTQWTRKNYGDEINNPGITKPEVDLGDGVTVYSEIQYNPGVTAPANYPSVTSLTGMGSLAIFRDYGTLDDNKVIVSLHMNTPMRPEFSIYDIDGWDGCFEKITVKGECSGNDIQPKLSYAGNPATSFYTISGGVATANVKQDLSPNDKNGQLNVAFTEGVTEITIEYAITNKQQGSTTHYLYISPVRFRSMPPPPVINEDGLYFVKDVDKREMTTCEQPVEYSFYIGNVNCEAKYVNFRDTLPEGLSWVPDGYGADTVDSHVKFGIEQTSDGKDVLFIDSLLAPGAGIQRVTATVTVYVETGYTKVFNNHAWIEYKQTVKNVEYDRSLQSADRETGASETQFLATGTEPLETIISDLSADTETYSADETVTFTIEVNNPNPLAVPDCWLDVSFNTEFTYVSGSLSSTDVPLPKPVEATLYSGNGLLLVAGSDNGAAGFTIPAGKSTFTFELKAPAHGGLAESTDGILPLKVEYVFTSTSTDPCIQLSMKDMSGMLGIPYITLMANPDYASTVAGVEVKAPILNNDSIPENCPLLVEFTDRGPKHGDPAFSVNKDSIIYRPDTGFAGYDSLEYRISCGSAKDSAYLYIYVAEKPDNIDDPNCSVSPTGYEWGMTGTYSNEFNLSPYQTTIVGDIDGDGIVEIITSAEPEELTPDDETTRIAKKLAIYKGNDIKAAPVIVNTVAGYNWHYRVKYGLVKTRIDNKDTVLIVVAEFDQKLRAYNYRGEKVWDGDAYHASQNDGTSPAFADLNHDGIPEIAIAGSLFNSSDGKWICSIQDAPYSSAQSIEVQLVDVFGDGNLKYILGNFIYDVEINSSNVITGLKLNREIPTPGGTVSYVKSLFADMDHDGRLDFIMAYTDGNADGNNARIYIADPLTGNIKADTMTKSSSSAGRMRIGYPFVGDVDNDGDNEIILITGVNEDASTYFIYCYKYSPEDSTLSCFWRLKHTDKSNFTGITLFDFDQDGNAELVYRDETLLRIIDGNTKSPYNKAEVPNLSGTSCEYPVVADVDGDGQAEIIIVSGLAGDNDPKHYGRLWVFKSEHPATAPWAPARRVWNQNSYHPLYVNEDLSIPKYPLNPATFFPGEDNISGTSDDVQPYNNFLQQQTVIDSRGLPFWLAADAGISSPVSLYHSDGDSLTVNISVTNYGDAGLQAPLYISTYKNAVDEANRMAIDSCMTIINPGASRTVSVTIRNLSSWLPLDKIIIRVNYRDGNYIQAECDVDKDNNTLEIPFASLLIAHDDHASTITGMEVLIPVLNNDSIPASCNALKMEIIDDQEHGSINIVNDTIYYTSYADFTGYDSLTYEISCNGDTARAKVYIYVAEKPDNISDADCYVTPPPPQVWDIRLAASLGEASVYAPPLTGDLDGDGRPEIVLPYQHGNIITSEPSTMEVTHRAQQIKIYKNKGGGDFSEFVFQTEKPYNPLMTGCIAIARVKIEGKDSAIIAVAEADLHLRAYNYNGVRIWESEGSDTWMTSDGNGKSGTSIGIADFNADGQAEIYTGNRIFNAATGKLLCKGTGNWGKGKDTNIGGIQAMTVAADIFGTGKLNLVAGSEVYEVAGDLSSMTAVSSVVSQCNAIPAMQLNGDGPTQVIDIDNDGKLEVLVEARTGINNSGIIVYIWSPEKQEILAQVNLPLSMHIGIPFVGDIDGDKYPEILFISDGPNEIHAYKYVEGNAALQSFWKLTHSDVSAMTGLTLFDFNQDGTAEIVYRDQTKLRIINGSNATTVLNPLEEYSCSSATGYEYPVIADVDGDGSAEILIGDANGTDYYSRNGPLRIFKSGASTKWAPARKVWNQYAYNAVNINEDLTVPRHPVSPATVFPGLDEKLGTSDDVRPYNNFLQQQTSLTAQGVPLWLIPDAKFAEVPVFNYYGDGDSLVIKTELTNIGDAGLLATFYVSAYKDEVNEANKIAVDSSMISLDVADTLTLTVTVRNMSSRLPLDTIIIRINDRGAAAYVQQECDYTNNEYKYPSGKLLMARNDTVPILYNTDTTVNVKLNDLIPAGCSPVGPTIKVDPVNGSAEPAHDSIKYTPDPGFFGVDSLVYGLTCISHDTVSNAEAKMYIIVSKPLEDSYIGCIDATVKAVGFEHIDDVEYYWYETKTGGTASLDSPTDARDCTAPEEWWIEVRYKGNALMPRFKITVEAYPELEAGSIKADQTICYGGKPDKLESEADASGGNTTPSYQWQYSTGTDGWKDITGATNGEYAPPDNLNVTTKYRRGATNGCGTVYTDPVTVTVYPESLFNYPDIRIRICPDPGKSVNLSKYIDTVSLKSLVWASVSPKVPISNDGGDIGSGTISTDDLKMSTVYTFTYTATNPCAKDGIKRKVYLETLKPDRMRPLRDTVVMCYEYAETLQLNQLFGIEAYGEFEFSPAAVEDYISRSGPPSKHAGAVVMNGKAIYINNAVPDYTYHGVATAKRVEVTYTPDTGSCLDGNEYTIVIILTPDMMK